MAFIKVRHHELNGFTGGKYHDEGALSTLIQYITNPSKTAPHLIGGISVNPQNAIYEMESLSMSCAQDSGVRLRHFILSFNIDELMDTKASSAEMAYRLAYLVAEYYGSQYQIVYAVHQNTDRIHVHFVMSTVNYLTGMKYNGTKQNHYRFLAHVTDVLGQYQISVQSLNDDVDKR